MDDQLFHEIGANVALPSGPLLISLSFFYSNYSVIRTMKASKILAATVGLLVTVAWLPSREIGAQSPGYDVLISSRGTHAVKRYDGETGAYIDDFIAARSGGLDHTQEVLIGHDGHFLVSGRFTSRILRFDRRSGAFLGNFSTG